MEKTFWKVTAIIFLVLFLLETSFFIWSVWIVTKEEQKDLTCYYDICADYPDAQRVGNLCTCYDYDVMGNYIITDTEIMR